MNVELVLPIPTMIALVKWIFVEPVLSERMRVDGLRKAGLCLLTCLLLSACVTTKPSSQIPGSSARIIENVPLRVWGDNSCGAGALSTVLNHWGDPVGEAELIRTLSKGKFGGIVTVDLLLEARRRGFDARLVRGEASLVEGSIADGKPVILMLRILDAPGGGVDLFHYIVADGIDPSRKLIRTQFGDGKVRWTSLGKLTRAWEGGGKATLLVQPSDRAAAPTEEAALREAVFLEESGKLPEAAASYRALLERHPRSILALTNLANVSLRLGQKQEAERLYRAAIGIDPHARDALNNLAWQLYEQGELEEAEELAQRAVAEGGADLDLVLDTLANIQWARGNCPGARATWERAASLAPAGERKEAALAALAKVRC